MDHPRDRPPVSKDDGEWLEVDGLTPVDEEDDDSWQEQCDFLTARMVSAMRAEGPTPWQKLIAQQRHADSMESDSD